MKTTGRCLLLAAVLAIVIAPGSGSARDMSGKFGIGYDQSLGGVSGINLKYHAGNFVVLGTLGFDFFKPENLDPRTAVKFALGALYNFSKSDMANAGIGIRANVGWRNGEAVTEDRRNNNPDCTPGTQCPLVQPSDDVWQFNIEIPLMIEVFLSDHFAFSLTTGLVLSILTYDDPALAVGGDDMATNTQEAGIGIGIGTGSVFGSAGFTYYF